MSKGDAGSIDNAVPTEAEGLRWVLDQLPALVWTTDRDLRFCSPLQWHVAKMDVPAEELEGTSVQSYFEDDQEAALERHQQALEGRQLKYAFVRAGRYYDAELQPLRDRTGEIVGVIGVALDVTQRRQLQEQLQAAQKMEVIGRLAGGMAHDFNNVLTIIVSYAQFLLDRFEPGDEAYEDAEVIDDAAKRAGALIQKLLAFSRRQVMKPDVVELSELVRDLEKMLEGLLDDNIELVMALHCGPTTVRVDQGQFEQAVINLAINARDAMPNGGKLIIETRDVELDEAYAETHVAVSAGRYAMLAVSDTGIGMTKQVQAQVFEPFFTTKGKGKGTGLGLSSVYGIVKQSQGSIWLYSEPGHGTTCKVYLPMVAQRPSQRPRRLSSPPLESSHERILLVEDDDSVRRGARRTLQNHGYRVIEARNGGEAVRICERDESQIDLMLTDVVMPEMNGPELRDRIATMHPETRVLFMSGYAEEAVRQHGVQTEETTFLPKPFSPHMLLHRVREVLAPTAKPLER
ncbi:MAG: response regulator [Myxococcales bacterium]|nr:response regulator [Myxococcales bacterium]